MRLLFNFASRSRPDKFFACLDNIRDMSSGVPYTVFAKFDVDDNTMNSEGIRNRMEHRREVNWICKNHPSKIDAINSSLQEYSKGFDIILNHSDDMWFTVKGFDKIIVDAMEQHFPDTDGFLHFPDQYAKEKLCTYSILGRVYYSRTNYIYHPAYKSLFCDNEATDVAKRLGKYAFIDTPIFEHRHPAAGIGVTDELYKRNEALWHKDKATYYRRKSLNFGI